jgi:hypothetical protein
MSKEKNRNIINAYEQMLKDVSAFKEVDLTMHTEPDLGEATGARGGEPIPQISDNPMGQPINEYEEDSGNYSEFDSVMEQRMNSLRNKMQGKKGGTRGNSGGTVTISQKEFISLKTRVKRLEEALTLVMETHEQLLG